MPENGTEPMVSALPMQTEPVKKKKGKLTTPLPAIPRRLIVNPSEYREEEVEMGNEP